MTKKKKKRNFGGCGEECAATIRYKYFATLNNRASERRHWQEPRVWMVAHGLCLWILFIFRSLHFSHAPFVGLFQKALTKAYSARRLCPDNGSWWCPFWALKRVEITRTHRPVPCRDARHGFEARSNKKRNAETRKPAMFPILRCRCYTLTWL
jgi:hypothetical protein